MDSNPVICPRCGIVSLAHERDTHTCCHCDEQFALPAAAHAATAAP